MKVLFDTLLTFAEKLDGEGIKNKVFGKMHDIVEKVEINKVEKEEDGTYFYYVTIVTNVKRGELYKLAAVVTVAYPYDIIFEEGTFDEKDMRDLALGFAEVTYLLRLNATENWLRWKACEEGMDGDLMVEKVVERIIKRANAKMAKDSKPEKQA